MMAKSQALADFEQIVERIIFNENELETLKVAIKNFTEGKISPKDLKQLLLQCRGRMMEDISHFTFYFAEKRIQNLLQTEINKEQLNTPTKIVSQLREEIKEKNELLESVANRVNQLVSKLNSEGSNEDQKSITIDDIKNEIKRCLNQIGAKEWIKMFFYNDYKFFVKLYPKLEALYKERYSESRKKSKDNSEGKEIMANKMKKLGFPKNIETIVINYLKIRNNFQHSMDDISQSNLELAREAYIKVFLYLIVSNLKTTFLLNNRENFYSCLKDIFSHRLTDNSKFRKKILEHLKTVFKRPILR